MAEPCSYARCTSKMTNLKKAVRLALPDEPEHRFCSLTCVWSWLKEHVEGKSHEHSDLQGMAALTDKITWSRVPDKTPRQKPMKQTRDMLPGPVTPPTQTFAPGTYDFHLIPDTTEIPNILRQQLDGPYHFVTESKRVPYVIVTPTTAEHPVTVRAGEQLRLRRGPSRTLRGLDDRITFHVHFQGLGGPIQLCEVLEIPNQWARKLLGDS